jgi:hypothetical protein
MTLAKFRPWLLGVAFLSCCAVSGLLTKSQAAQKSALDGASASQIHLPDATRVTVKYPDGSDVKLSPEEQVAFVFLVSMEFLEYNCLNPAYLGRACSLEELIKGVPAKNGKVLGFTENPNRDANYRYALTFSETGYQLEAVPQRPGLGGFLCLGKKGWMFADRFYNPKGAATSMSSRLGNMNVAGFDFSRR